MRNSIPVVVSLAASVAAAPRYPSSSSSLLHGPPQQQNVPSMGMGGPSQAQSAASMNVGGAGWTAPASQDARKPDLVRGDAQKGGSQQQAGPQHQNSPAWNMASQQRNGSPQDMSSQRTHGHSQGVSYHQQGPSQQQKKNTGVPQWTHPEEWQRSTTTTTVTLPMPTSSGPTFTRGDYSHDEASSQHVQAAESSILNAITRSGLQQTQATPSRPAWLEQPYLYGHYGYDKHGHYHGEQQDPTIVITVTRTYGAGESQTPVATTKTSSSTPSTSTSVSTSARRLNATHSRLHINYLVGGLPTRGPLLDNDNEHADHDTPVHSHVSRDLAATEAENLIIPSDLKGLARKLEADLKEKIEDLLAAAKVNDIISKIIELIGDIKSGDFKSKLMEKIPEFLAAIKELFSADNVNSIKENVEDVISGNHGLMEVKEWVQKMKGKVEGRNSELLEGLTTTVGGLLGGGGGGGGDGAGDFSGDFGGLKERAVEPNSTENAQGHSNDLVDALKDKFHSDPAARQKELERVKAKSEKLLRSFEPLTQDLKEKLDKAQSSKGLHINMITEKVKAGLGHITQIVQTFKAKGHELETKTGTESVMKTLLPQLKLNAEEATKHAAEMVLGSVKGHLPHVDAKMGDDLKVALKGHQDDAMKLIADVAGKLNAKGKVTGSVPGPVSAPGAFPVPVSESAPGAFP